MPVFTKIETTEAQYNESELDGIIDNLNRKKKAMGLTRLESFDIRYKEMLRKAPKKNRIKIDYPVDLNRLERIIITPSARGYISTAFLDFAKTSNMAIYWVDGRGRIEMSLMPHGFVKPSLAIKQLEARINGSGIKIARYIIKLNLESQGMEDLSNDLDRARTVSDITGIEGNASRLYYDWWIIPPEFNWHGRHGRRKFNMNAVDPVNTMLNLGYGLLAQQMSEILMGRGWELQIGFLHQSETINKKWNMLNYDFMEPYRVWIDNCVKEMIADNEIKANGFTFSEDKKSMIFKQKALEVALDRFIEALEPLEHKSLPIIRTVEKMLLS